MGVMDRAEHRPNAGLRMYAGAQNPRVPVLGSFLKAGSPSGNGGSGY